MPSTTEWMEIRARYEAGEGPKAIADSYGISRQTVHNVANREGWERHCEEVSGVLLPKVDLPAKFTDGLKPEQLAVLREVIAGSSPSGAAVICGVSPASVTRWKKGSETFSNALESAQALKTARRVAKIESDNTWKSAAWLIQHDPTSKDEWANAGPQGNLVGNTFNVLGRLELGISRDPKEHLTADNE